MSVQEDIAKAARAGVDPLYRDIERLELTIMRKRERGENYERELEAIHDTRMDIQRMLKPYIEWIATLPPAPVVVDSDLVINDRPEGIEGRLSEKRFRIRPNNRTRTAP